jgi:hypothetical protein
VPKKGEDAGEISSFRGINLYCVGFGFVCWKVFYLFFEDVLGYEVLDGCFG